VSNVPPITIQFIFYGKSYPPTSSPPFFRSLPYNFCPWRADEATALAQLFPLDDTSHSQKDDGTKSSSTSSSTSSGITSTSNSVSSNTAGLRLARTRHGPLLFNVRDLPAGVSLDTQGEWCVAIGSRKNLLNNFKERLQVYSCGLVSR